MELGKMPARGLMIRRVIRERQWMLHSPEMPEWNAGLRFAMRESPSPPLLWGRIAIHRSLSEAAPARSSSST
jgi:hypothetical protein